MFYLFKAYIHSLAYYAPYNGLNTYTYLAYYNIYTVIQCMYLHSNVIHVYTKTHLWQLHTRTQCNEVKGNVASSKFWGSCATCLLWPLIPISYFKLRHQPLMWTLGTCPASVPPKKVPLSGREKKSGSKLVCLPPPSGGLEIDHQFVGPMMFWISPVTHDIKSKFTPTSSSLIVTLNPSGPQGRKLARWPFLTGNIWKPRSKQRTTCLMITGKPLAFLREMKRRDVHNFWASHPSPASGAL